MEDKRLKSAISILPEYIKEAILQRNYPNIEEIRVKAQSPLFLYGRKNEIILRDIKGEIIYASLKDMAEILKRATENSMYACTDDIKSGFITLFGGHRIGICGSAVTEGEKIIHIKDIQSINIRIAREIIGISNHLMRYIMENGKVKNTLIISPPKAGKTTLLRDIVRNLSNIENMKISLLDERDEIAALYHGIPQNDVGMRTFVLSGYSKKDGFIHSIRSLSPTVIVCDEIGGEDDLMSLKNAVNRGVKVISSIHGYSKEDVFKKKGMNELSDIFECFIVYKDGRFTEE